jgi:hypothetical protein
VALQARHLSLTVFEDMDALASYTGFLVQKKVGQSHLKNVVSTYIKVLAFLDATERCGDAPHVDAKMAWLCNLKSQVSKLVARPSKDSVQLKEEGVHAHSNLPRDPHSNLHFCITPCWLVHVQASGWTPRSCWSSIRRWRRNP